MMTNDSAYVFNSDAVIVSALMLLGVLVFHAFYLFCVNLGFHKSITWLSNRRRIYSLEIFFLASAFILSMAHILEVLLLGYAIYLIGLVPNIHHAIVFAGSTYSTVGFGTDPLQPSWQLVMVTMALSGLITVAWTTSVLFGMSTTTRSLQLKILGQDKDR
mgnify:CR=1 FL=1